MPTLDPSRTINGSFGELHIGGVWQTQIQQVSGKITITRKEIKLAGSRQTGYKATSTTGDGTIQGFKVTSYWLKVIGAYQRHASSFMPEATITLRLNDPEAYGIEEIELLGCKFWEVPIGYQVDELVQESIPFTFVNHNLRQCMDGSMETWVSEGQELGNCA